MTDEQPSAADEVEILDPDRRIEIAGETVIVREFRYAEGMRLSPSIEPILERLRTFVAAESPPDDTAIFQALVSESPDSMLDLMAHASDRPREWVERLADADGLALASAFWGANSHFFVRRLMLTSPELRAAVANRAAAVDADSVSRSSSS